MIGLASDFLIFALLVLVPPDGGISASLHIPLSAGPPLRYGIPIISGLIVLPVIGLPLSFSRIFIIVFPVP